MTESDDTLQLDLCHYEGQYFDTFEECKTSEKGAKVKNLLLNIDRGIEKDDVLDFALAINGTFPNLSSLRISQNYFPASTAPGPVRYMVEWGDFLLLLETLTVRRVVFEDWQSTVFYGLDLKTFRRTAERLIKVHKRLRLCTHHEHGCEIANGENVDRHDVSWYCKGKLKAYCQATSFDVK
jgi:hypothetical protein